MTPKVSRAYPKVVSRIVIKTAAAHPRELRTAADLRAPRSHPVLLLDTQRGGDQLLATYMHQQMHWWAAAHPGLGDAITDTQQTWATVPTVNGGGAATEIYTRVLLIVCHLERRALHHILGDVRSRVVLRAQITTGRVHPWVYGQIQLHGRRLDQICSARRLWPDRLEPAH